jgi:hypothetical protein
MSELEDGDSEPQQGEIKQERVPEYGLSGSRWSAYIIKVLHVNN